MNNNLPLIWIDLEMTGLDPNKEKIIEIATIITDAELALVAEGPNLIINIEDTVLNAMDEWCVKTHGASGLTEKVRTSKISTREAELQTLEFLKGHVEAGKIPLCGNSIHQDRRFLEREMPELNDFFHYRNVDVSTIKELANRWYPTLNPCPKKEAHTALSDIRESIEELKYYKELIFK